MNSLRLLIIEDDPDQRELIREQVEDRFGRGTVVGVGTRKEALSYDAAKFDLIRRLAPQPREDKTEEEVQDPQPGQSAAPTDQQNQGRR